MPGLVEALTRRAAALRVGDPRDEDTDVGLARRPLRRAAAFADAGDLRRAVVRRTTRASLAARRARLLAVVEVPDADTAIAARRARRPRRRRSRSGPATRQGRARLAAAAVADDLGRPPRDRAHRRCRCGSRATSSRASSSGGRRGPRARRASRRRDQLAAQDRLDRGPPRARGAPVAGAAARRAALVRAARRAVSGRCPSATATHRSAHTPHGPRVPLPRIFVGADDRPQRTICRSRPAGSCECQCCRHVADTGPLGRSDGGGGTAP